jgi:thioredoxin-like negative regulator of GroEL
MEIENHKVKFYKFNIEEGKELGIELGVRSIPTIIGFSDGESKIFTTGVKSQEQLIEMANTLL